MMNDELKLIVFQFIVHRCGVHSSSHPLAVLYLTAAVILTQRAPWRMRDGTDSRYHCARTNDTSDAARWKQRRTYGSERVSGMSTDETNGDGVQTRAIHAG